MKCDKIKKIKIITFLIYPITAIQFFGFPLALASESIAQDCGTNYSALVFEEKTGNIFFEKHPDKIIYPASLTKLMTIYLSFEAIEKDKLKLEDQLFVSDRAISISKVNKNNTVHLKEEDKVSVKQAIIGSIVKSYNELTVLLAERISGSEWDFVRKMNIKARELKMYSTNFRNSSGLHDGGQFTTDEDLAKLVLAIKQDFPQYYHFFAKKEFIYNGKKYLSHNHFLLNYKGAEGLKTGFTKIAGFNLVAVASKDHHRIISILTGCESFKKRDEFAKELMDLSFNKLREN